MAVETMGPALDPALFRSAMGSFASGVTVVGVDDGEMVHGMTANAFLSGSAEPPLCVVSVNKRARTHALLLKAGCFGVSILAEHQEPLARHYSGRRNPKERRGFERLAGMPVLRDGCAAIAARLTNPLDCGDHTLFVGRVIALEVSERAPLLYFRGGFRRCTERVAKAPSPEFW